MGIRTMHRVEVTVAVAPDLRVGEIVSRIEYPEGRCCHRLARSLIPTPQLMGHEVLTLNSTLEKVTVMVLDILVRWDGGGISHTGGANY